jgi:hypothetical protein
MFGQTPLSNRQNTVKYSSFSCSLHSWVTTAFRWSKMQQSQSHVLHFFTKDILERILPSTQEPDFGWPGLYTPLVLSASLDFGQSNASSK